MSLRVETHYSCSRCVIWKHREHYIDVRQDHRSTRYETAECVRNGRVYRLVIIDLAKDAPAQVMALVREELI